MNCIGFPYMLVEGLKGKQCYKVKQQFL